MRTGLIAEKVGMSRVLDENGRHIPVTLLKVDSLKVVSVMTEANNGYNAVQLGVGKAKVKNVSKPMRGHFAKAKVEPSRKLAEFRVSSENLLNVGDEISVEHFIKGQHIDVQGKSIGKGFAGAMKRHNFGGLRASHGVSVSHRSHGSTGQCQDPGKVFKGKKMAGHMGAATVTAQSLEVVDTDPVESLIFVKGSIPGSKGSFVILSDSEKKKLPSDLPMPAALVKSNGPEVKETSEPTTEKSVEEKKTAETPEGKE